MSAAALRDLKALLDEGVIDEDEYEEKAAEFAAEKKKPAAKKPAAKKAKKDDGDSKPAAKKPAAKKAKKDDGDDLESLTVAKLKAKCKEHGCVASGEKGVLIWRIKLCVAVETEGIRTADGRSPFELKAGELKKAASKFGVSPMGTNDELLEGFVNALRKQKPASEAVAGAPASGASGAQGLDAAAVARKVLELAEGDEHEAILSLGSAVPLTARSPANDLRKAYRKLSVVIHPDKLRGFDGATRAFQALVTALERVTNPEPTAEVEESGKGKKKTPRFERSNEGCVKSLVSCPRCGVRWGASAMDGLPDYAYNLMMTGLRTYTCSTCLCEFGCCSAKHACHKCGADLDYSPADFHRTIECTACNAAFGFWNYHISERNLNEAIKEARATHAANAKTRAAKQRRAAAANRRGAEEEEEDALGAETLFLVGLSDTCPRCGDFFGAGTTREEKAEHLSCCADAEKNARHAGTKTAAKARTASRAAVADKQQDAQATATWEALGGQTETLWMLPDAALAEMAGMDATTDRCELVAAAAASRDAGRFLTDGSQASKKPAATRRKLTAESLPADWASLPVAQLRAICAAHGFVPQARAKDALIREIDNELIDDKKPLMIAGAKRGRDDDDDDDDEDDESDGEYRDDDHDVVDLT